MIILQASEDFGEFGNMTVVVSGNWFIIAIEDEAAIIVKQKEADGEQLHDFTGVIFVGEAVEGRVGLAVASVAEIVAHQRMQCYVVQQVAEIAEGVLQEQIVPLGRSIGQHCKCRPFRWR